MMGRGGRGMMGEGWKRDDGEGWKRDDGGGVEGRGMKINYYTQLHVLSLLYFVVPIQGDTLCVKI